ncbi:MAG TPA: metallophosphoesterase [Clostridia bacterium]|nr:metallophosphoesterase [Clostridia bacterium]
MKVYCIGDLHLPGNSEKPMDVFGHAWDDHPTRIREAWRDTVESHDLVLVPGDISWAMRLEDVREDLAFIGSLPGTKLLLRGNHDYWWNSISKVRALLPEGCFALQNDAFHFGDFAFAGSRGWVCPGSAGFSEEEDRGIYERELIRLGLSLDAAKPGERLLAMLHFPPFNEKRMSSGFTSLLESHGVETVVYGHLHDKACASAFEGKRGGVSYMLCSADHIGFTPRLIAQS